MSAPATGADRRRRRNTTQPDWCRPRAESSSARSLRHVKETAGRRVRTCISLEDELQSVEQHELQVLGPLGKHAIAEKVDRSLALLGGWLPRKRGQIELIGDRAGVSSGGQYPLDGRSSCRAFDSGGDDGVVHQSKSLRDGAVVRARDIVAIAAAKAVEEKRGWCTAPPFERIGKLHGFRYGRQTHRALDLKVSRHIRRRRNGIEQNLCRETPRIAPREVGNPGLTPDGRRITRGELVGVRERDRSEDLTQAVAFRDYF